MYPYHIEMYKVPLSCNKVECSFDLNTTNLKIKNIRFL